MKRIIEITIITTILFGLAFCFGCKDKAEANEPGLTFGTIEFRDPNEQTHAVIYGLPSEGDVLLRDPNGNYTWVPEEPNEPIQRLMKQFEQMLGQEEKLIDVIGLCIDRIEKLEENHNEPAINLTNESGGIFVITEPNDLKIDIKSHYTAEELDEIYKDEPALGKLAKSLWGVDEPNKLGIRIIAPEENWKCSCGMDWGEMFEIFCDCGKTYKTLDIIMKCIPTWPDYIELEKELVIKEPADISEIAGREHDFSFSIELAKGKKINFKD